MENEPLDATEAGIQWVGEDSGEAHLEVFLGNDEATMTGSIFLSKEMWEEIAHRMGWL